MIDFPFFNLLTIAHNVSITGNASTINGATITINVYVLAIPNIDIIESEYPKKLEPVSPINVLAGLKLNGKNPVKAPAHAVISIIAITGESFNENIISKDRHDINDIPDDKPSNPSIRLIAFVIPTIHPIVSIVVNTSL